MKQKSLLVVYYSHSGNTAKAAAEIARRMGGELAEIRPAAPYPDEYRAVVERANQEIPAGLKPPLEPLAVRPEDYDFVLVGTPNWCGTIAPPCPSFLAAHNWNGRRLALFCTHGGGLSHTAQDAEKLSPGALFGSGMAVRDGDLS